MPHPVIKPEYVEFVVQFAGDIGMVPVVIKKEQPAYILNTLLILLLEAGLEKVPCNTWQTPRYDL